MGEGRGVVGVSDGVGVGGVDGSLDIVGRRDGSSDGWFVGFGVGRYVTVGEGVGRGLGAREGLGYGRPEGGWVWLGSSVGARVPASSATFHCEWWVR